MSNVKKIDVPKKGDVINAKYVVNGAVKRSVDLGTVQEANTKTFTDGMGIKRQYNFDAVNGVRLVSFSKPKEEIKEEK